MKNIRVATKLHLITAMAILSTLAVAAMLLLNGRSSMMEEKKIATRDIVESAYAIVAFYQAQAAAGKMPDAQARASALDALRAIRFGSQNYVWVNDMHPTVVMHPISPQLDGQDATGIKDPTGKALFVRFVEVVKARQAGFVQYLWPKPGLTQPVPKVSYVKGFAPWGWVIGSGIYVDDVAAAFRANLERTAALVLAAIAVFVVISTLVARSITRPLRQAVDLAERVAHGDLTSEIRTESHDEVGDLLHALNNMNESLGHLVHQVRRDAETIASASGEIAAGNQDLSSRTEQQAASLEETAASMDELTSTVRQNADSAMQANDLARSASDVAAQGGEVVTRVVHTMSSINESSHKVTEIVAVIDGIAFQTNILALNAAVEAARAGEQGKGFAVVAAEVRSLAQRCAAAAREVKKLIQHSVLEVDAGTKLVARAGDTMEKVVDSIGKVTRIMAEISLATQEQTSGIQQVDQAITQMDRVTQQNAALVEQAAAAANALRNQADELLDAVSVFKVPAEDEAEAAAAVTPVMTVTVPRCRSSADAMRAAECALA